MTTKEVTLHGMDIPEHMTAREAVYYVIDAHKHAGTPVQLVTIPQFTYFDVLADTVPHCRFLCSIATFKIDGIPVECLKTTSPHYSMAMEGSVYWLPSDKSKKGATTGE